MKPQRDRLPQDRAMRIKRIAALGSFGALCLAVLLPASVVGVLSTMDAETFAQGFSVDIPVPIETGARAAATVILALPAFALAVSLLYLRKTFNAFASAEYFGFKTFEALLRFARWLAVGVLLSMVGHTAAPLVLGARALSIEIGSQQVITLGVAALIYLLAHILTLASDLEAENKQFV